MDPNVGVHGGRIAEALVPLREYYAGFRWESELWASVGPRRSPYRALLVFGLSPRTKDGLLVDMCRRFFRRFPGYQELAGWRRSPRIDATEDCVGDIVRAGQLPFVRSLAEALEEHGGVPRAKKDLLRITGVGEKIAECVLAYAWGEDALPVDVYMRRVLDRINGVAPAGKDNDANSLRGRLKCVYVEYQRKFGEAAEAMVDVHEILRLHGQISCTRIPVCAACPVGGCASRRAPMGRAQNRPLPLTDWDDWRELLLEPTG